MKRPTDILWQYARPLGDKVTPSGYEWVAVKKSDRKEVEAVLKLCLDDSAVIFEHQIIRYQGNNLYVCSGNKFAGHIYPTVLYEFLQEFDQPKEAVNDNP